MMNEATKEKMWESFRDSSEYSKATYFILQILNLNISHLARNVDLYGILIKKIDDGSIKHSFNKKQLLHIKQNIVLDTNSRIMTGIETLFALIFSLNEGYSTVAKIITYYELSIIDSSINSIKKKLYNLRKIIGLCEIEKFDLTDEEKKILGLRYQSTCDIFQEALEKFVSYYQKYKIIYGKHKHGLSIITGISNTENMTFENSMLAVFDRREKDKMPPETISIKRDLGGDVPWYTSESILKIDKKLFSEMGTISRELEEFFTYIISNHLSFAENCGEGYVPFRYENGDEKIRPGIFFGDKFSESEEKIFNEMIFKIASEMYAPKRALQFNITVENDDVKKSLEEKIVTNIWSDSDS